MSFDINKPYTTRAGQKARAIEGPDKCLYGYYYADFGAGPLAGRWCPNGAFLPSKNGRETQLDLVNIPERRTVKVWLNVYEDGARLVRGYASRQEADASCAPDRIACIERELTYEVGEGL